MLTWLVALLLGSGVAAQEQTAPAQVLIIDSERLYLESGYGRSIIDFIEEQAAALQAENDVIEDQLIQEERSLAERRADMPVDDFRAEATAFDEKVQQIRRARDAKIAQLEQTRLAGRDQFRDDVRGIVGRLMLERGAVVLLDRRTVFLAVGTADITAEAIARIDAELLPSQEDAPTP